jgi:acyl carrier protein
MELKVHSNLEERLTRVFAEVFGLSPDQITDDASPKTIPRWDSMNAMVLTMALEEEFDVQFTDRELVKMNTFAAIREALIAKTAEKTIG